MSSWQFFSNIINVDASPSNHLLQCPRVSFKANNESVCGATANAKESTKRMPAKAQG